MKARLLPVLLLLSVPPAGCAATRECSTGSDCLSGICSSDGVCADDDESPISSSSTEGGATGSGTGGSGGAGGSQPAGGAGGCVANGDGQIERHELPLMAGLGAKLRVATNVVLDSAGVEGKDGRLWDLSASLPGDHGALIETLSTGDRWFGAKFPGATYAAKLSDGEDLLGVFDAAPDRLLLAGVVSPEPGLMRTELAYDPPASMLELPLYEGRSWQSTAAVTGLAEGVAAVYQERYEALVDAHGEVITPLGTYSVLRVRVALTRTVGVVQTVTQTHVLVAECAGNVATLVSQPNTKTAEFKDVAEVRRLAP